MTMKHKKPEIFLKRKFETFLIDWKDREDRLPLIVKGARQVGKTEIIRHFSTGRYASFIEINFALEPEYKAITRDGYSAESIVRNISLIEPRFQFLEHDTLIFFDEIQEFPEIATCFKSFAQQGKFDVIGSGSLLGIQLKKIESISVGYQETAVMHSLDFEEFLIARGYRKEQLDELYGNLVEARPFGDVANAAFERLFLDYVTLGGMPEVVERYFLKGTFEGTLAIQRRIISDYRSDVRKYAEGLDPQRIVGVFESIPAQLAKENKKFQLSCVAKNARYKDYWGCVEWLNDAGIVNVCKMMDFPELPIIAHLNATKYKLYMADSGLLLSMLDEESQEDIRVRRDLGTW
jgi:predicted AAA+ superfamily ATPase